MRKERRFCLTICNFLFIHPRWVRSISRMFSSFILVSFLLFRLLFLCLNLLGNYLETAMTCYGNYCSSIMYLMRKLMVGLCLGGLLSVWTNSSFWVKSIQKPRFLTMANCKVIWFDWLIYPNMVEIRQEPKMHFI